MPVDNGIGHSSATPDKQIGFGAFLGQHMNIVRAVLNKHPYYYRNFIYIDANAGSGSNMQEGCDGSPVIFLKTAQAVDVPYEAHFIDNVEGNTQALAAATSWVNHKQIYTGQQEDIVPQIVERYRPIKNKVYGMIYTDPNNLPNFDMLADVSRTMPKLDIMIRMSATINKRVSGSKAQKDSAPRIDLGEELIKINKEAWIIRDARPGDKFQWTFLFGTNYANMKAWHKYDFHRLDEERGALIFQRLNLTADDLEQFKQSPLFDTPRRQALARSGGQCELCGNIVTEVHHYCYPALTARDVVAVCHKCHCDIEGVSQ